MYMYTHMYIGGLCKLSEYLALHGSAEDCCAGCMLVQLPRLSCETVGSEASKPALGHGHFGEGRRGTLEMQCRGCLHRQAVQTGRISPTGSLLANKV